MAQTLQPGTPLQGGKYVIKQVLGQGGFGITYLARQVSLGRDVAIKEFFMQDNCLRNKDSDTVSVPSTGSATQVEKYRKKFDKEARTLALLDHPHIVRVIEIFEENGTVYYVMQHLPGGSLKDLVKKRGPLPEDEALHWVGQIAEALQYMHQEHRICHYDVKPGNILLDRKGNAVLIDFGISKNYDKDGNETSTTPIGLSTGYAPIEQYQGISVFSPASDVYALGATLYTLVMGHQPESALTLAQGIPLEFDRAISPSTRKLISRAMKVSARERLQSVDEFLDNTKKPAKKAPAPKKPLDGETTRLPDDKPGEGPKPPKEAPALKKPLDGETTRLPDDDKLGEGAKPPKKGLKILVIGLIAAAVIGLGIFALLQYSGGNNRFDAEKVIQQAIEDMVHVEGGTFTMGATEEQRSDAEDNEKPAHEVTLSGFYISKYEVTQELWLAVMGSNPSYFTGDLKRPVENVSWKDCQAFINKLNAKTGKQFRLPTEAEWEYAARGGNRSGGYKYAGSNDIDDVAWYYDNALDVGEASPDFGTHAVGTKSPNELGLYDMSGNVWEWCQDWYGEDYYKHSPSNNPTGPTSGSYRVIRGDSWNYIGCRVSNRCNYNPSITNDILGLRLAL